MPGLLCFLFLAGFCAAKDTAVFYGGSLSFVTFRDHTDNDTAKVHLKLLTGWKTGKGPCGLHCPRSRTRTSTLQSRKSMLLAKGQEYFGTWKLEWRDKHDVVHTNDISPIIAANLTEKVESVNPMAEWELDTADVFVPIPEEIKYVDIIYVGHSWLELTLNKPPVQPPNWHMQVKVYSHSRSDTMKPNRSPVVQMKPFFKYVVLFLLVSSIVLAWSVSLTAFQFVNTVYMYLAILAALLAMLLRRLKSKALLVFFSTSSP